MGGSGLAAAGAKGAGPALASAARLARASLGGGRAVEAPGGLLQLQARALPVAQREGGEAAFQPGRGVAEIEGDRLLGRPAGLRRAAEKAQRAGAKGMRVAVQRRQQKRGIERCERQRIHARLGLDAGLVDQDGRIVGRQGDGDGDHLRGALEVARQQPDVGRLGQQFARRDAGIASQRRGDSLQALGRDVEIPVLHQRQGGAMLRRRPAPLFCPSAGGLEGLYGIAGHEGQASPILPRMVQRRGPGGRGSRRREEEGESRASGDFAHVLREAPSVGDDQGSRRSSGDE